MPLSLPLETQPDGRVWVKCECVELVRHHLDRFRVLKETFGSKDEEE